MSKRPSIIDNLPLADQEPAPTAEILTLTTNRRHKNPDVQHTSVYIPRVAHDRLREIAFVERCRVHDLIMEGLDLLIASRGHPETATRKKA